MCVPEGGKLDQERGPTRFQIEDLNYCFIHIPRADVSEIFCSDSKEADPLCGGMRLPTTMINLTIECALNCMLTFYNITCIPLMCKTISYSTLAQLKDLVNFSVNVSKGELHI